MCGRGGRPDTPLNDRQELERAERLAHERGGARALRVPRLFRLRPGQQDDRDVARRVVGLEPAAQLDAVHLGHPEIEHDDVGSVTPHAQLRLDAGPGLVDRHVSALERSPQQLAQRGLVVDEQDSHRICGSSLHALR